MMLIINLTLSGFISPKCTKYHQMSHKKVDNLETWKKCSFHENKLSLILIRQRTHPNL